MEGNRKGQLEPSRITPSVFLIHNSVQSFNPDPWTSLSLQSLPSSYIRNTGFGSELLSRLRLRLCPASLCGGSVGNITGSLGLGIKLANSIPARVIDAYSRSRKLPTSFFKFLGSFFNPASRIDDLVYLMRGAPIGDKRNSNLTSTKENQSGSKSKFNFSINAHVATSLRWCGGIVLLVATYIGILVGWWRIASNTRVSERDALILVILGLAVVFWLVHTAFNLMLLGA